MSVMNDLDLKLKEAENQLNQTQETIRSIRQLLSSNENEASCEDRQHKRDIQADKEAVRGMLAKQASKGLTKEVKELLKKFGAEKLSDVNPKDYEDLYYSAESLDK